jgi:hypothetical protein
MTTSRIHALVLFLASATMAVGLAQAQQPAQGSKPAAQAAAPTSANSQSAQKTTAAAQKLVDPNAQLIKDARNAGFKPMMIRGTQMFCRTAIELGSSFPVRTCYDADQVKIKIHEYAEQRNQLEQMHSTGLGVH